MSALQIIVTDVGRAEIVNAENTGTAPVVVAQVGLGSGQYVPAANQTALVSEVKRLATISGQVVADDTIHVTVLDEGPDVYDVSEIGLYSASGTLLAVYAQVGEPVMQKVASSSLLLSVDVVVSSLNAASLTLGDTSFSNPPATTTVKGVVELATVSETQMGADGTRAVTPASLKPALDQKLDKAGGTVSGDISFGAKMEAAANYEPSAWTSLITKKYADQHGKDAGIGVSAIGWADDLSLLTAGGHYSYGAVTANKPSGHAYGEVIHMAGESGASATQIAIEHNSNLISARRKQSGAWQPWYKVATDADLANLQIAINGKSPVGHGHQIADVSSLQTVLDGKASTAHTHTIANITNLQSSLNGKQPNLGFVPVQQGTGANQGSNLVRIGWGNEAKLRCQIDNMDFGSTWPININLANVNGLQSALDDKVSLSAFTGSFAANGWTRLPNGLIIQWGTSAGVSPDANVYVTYPTTFPNICGAVVATTRLNDPNNFDVFSRTVAFSRSGATFRAESTGGELETSNIDWIAIGF